MRADGLRADFERQRQHRQWRKAHAWFGFLPSDREGFGVALTLFAVVLFTGIVIVMLFGGNDWMVPVLSLALLLTAFVQSKRSDAWIAAHEPCGTCSRYPVSV